MILVDLANWSRITDPTGKLAVVGLGISNAARPVQGWDGVNNKKVSNALLTDACNLSDYGTGVCSESLASTYPAPAKITVDIGTIDLAQNAPPTSPGGVGLAIAVDGSAGSYVNIGSLSKPAGTIAGFAGGVAIGGNCHVDANGVPDLTAQTLGIAIPVGLENIKMSDLDSGIGVGPGANVSVKYTEVYDTAHGAIGASSGFPKLSSAQSTLSTYVFPKVKSGDEDFQFVKSVGLQSTFLTASNNIFGYDKSAQMVKVGSDPNMPTIGSLNGDKSLTCSGTNFDVLVAGSPYCAGRIPVGIGVEKDVETNPSVFNMSLTKSLVGVNSPGVFTANKYAAAASGNLSLQGTCFTPDGSLCNTTGIVSCTTPGSGCNAVVAKEIDVATAPPADVGVSIFGNGVSDNLLASWSGGFSGDMSTCSG
jgi:hypothetical protein